MKEPVKLKELSGREYQRIIERSTPQFEEIIPQIIPIIKKVRDEGDEAILNFTEKFDKVKLCLNSLRVSKKEIEEAFRKVSPSFVSSVRKMHQQVEDFHRHQVPKDWSVTKNVPDTVILGQKFSPVEKAAIYIPGGKASYPSTAIMGCVPAKLAGVKEVVVCSPPSPEGKMRPEVIVASCVAGADLLINAGGAQAIAALAFGTENIPRVQVIAGPGNKFVTCAKVYVASYGKVGIDCLAGPSEVLIIADRTAPSSHVAWDIISQAEHDEASWSVLVTDSERLARGVYEKIQEGAEHAQRKSIICSSLEKNGLILLVKSLKEAVDFANRFAPEHVEIITKDPESLLPLIKSAGSIFLGPFSPVAAGDYFTGTNHILPTGGSARFSSGLSVSTFLKRITHQRLSSGALSSMREPVSHLAREEGFQAHLRSIEIRESDVDI